MNPDQTTAIGIHIVCNICYLMTRSDERAVDTSWSVLQGFLFRDTYSNVKPIWNIGTTVTYIT